MRRWIIALILVGVFAYCLYAQPGPIQPIITNLTQFVNQTAWRLFYSNTDGDVTELAFGTSGQYLKSNGATSAPTWATPGGTGDLLADGSVPMTDNWDIGNFDITLKSLTGDGTIEGATLTEGGNAVYNATEVPGGELGGTFASFTIDDGIAVSNWNLTTPTITTSLTTSTPKTISVAELDRLDGLAGIIVTDVTAVTDIEGTGLSIGGTTLNWSAASTDLTDTAALLYETELDDFSELQTQISNKTLVNEEDAVTWDALGTFDLQDLKQSSSQRAMPRW